MPIILQDGNIVCGTEVSFLNRDEINYPQLMRLHLDFDFRVLSLSNSLLGNNPLQDNSAQVSSLQANPVRDCPLQDSPLQDRPLQDDPLKDSSVFQDMISTDQAACKDSGQTSRYLITFNTHQNEDVPTITPVFTSLSELESYANDNIVDILNQLVIDAQED